MEYKFYAGIAAMLLTTGSALAEELTVAGHWTGTLEETIEEVLEVFAQSSGHDVRYIGMADFESQIPRDLEAGSPPNIAVFPQPGLASDLAARGFLTPLKDGTATWLSENYAAGDSWVDLGTYADANGDEQLYGFPYKIDLKSLVWYVPENFEDAGYEVPNSMEELKALTEQIVADGETPWCIGLESGVASGWPATDWVEEILLRTHPPEVYDAWVSNDIPFDAPQIVDAIEEFGVFARNDDNVAGRVSAVNTTSYDDSPAGLFTSPVRCYMHRQGSFIPAFFPENAEAGEDYDFFYFPTYAERDLGSPILGAGAIWVITDDSPAAHELIEFLKTPEAHETWMGLGGFLTPHKGVDSAAFADPTLRKMNDILLEATTFRFDASDLMPSAVGTGTFWTGMLDYVDGKDAIDVASDIQASWDAVK
ncbi:MAG: ABC transporter substrate-binding protein [Pseudomonadota bacterium]